MFRRELRDRADVYRNRYLTFRAGYRYRTSLTPGASVSENRGIVEVTPRYLLPWQLVVSDRNRGEFRFVKGQTFSTRYRNRLQLERDIKYGTFVFTPYVYDEIFYDYPVWPVDPEPVCLRGSATDRPARRAAALLFTAGRQPLESASCQRVRVYLQFVFLN